MKLTDQDLKDMFGQTPDSFTLALEKALAGESAVEKAPTRRLRKGWTIALILALALALTTGGYAAALRMGLLDMLGRNSTVGPVPQSAQELLAKTEAQAFEVGPLTVSFNEMIVDGYMCYSIFQSRVTDGSEALLINWTDSFYLPIPACYRGYAEARGVSESYMGFLAESWEGPIYSVSAWLETDRKFIGGEEMILDNEWGADGSILTGRMLTLDPQTVGETLPVTLYLHVQEMRTVGKVNRESFSLYCPVEEVAEWREEIPLELPVHGVFETREYEVVGDGATADLVFTGMTLERTGAEFYARLYATVTDESRLDRYRFDFPWFEVTDGDGQLLPSGMLGSYWFEDDRWPELTLRWSLALEAFPETVLLPYGDQTVTLRLKE